MSFLTIREKQRTLRRDGGQPHPRSEPVLRMAFCAAVKGLGLASAPDAMRVLDSRW